MNAVIGISYSALIYLQSVWITGRIERLKDMAHDGADALYQELMKKHGN